MQVPDTKSSNPQHQASALLAARLHFIPRFVQPLQLSLLQRLNRYFSQAPGWVILTTIGRKSGLPRQVLLPCERMADSLIVISTYGMQSNWIRNIRDDPQVHVTVAGWVVKARAEIIVDLETKRTLVSQHPFFPPLPIGPLNWMHRTILRRPTVAFLRWWVDGRPVVVVRRDID